MGRARLNIDSEQVERLAALGCTNSEMAVILKCSKTYLTDNHQEAIERGRENGKMRLRMAQMKAALSGNTTMQIWLGKQLLGQADRVDNKISGELPPLVINYVNE